ncbi:MAG: hypothetical protein R3E84_09895 [Pseudomonadales bacterium]
MNTANAGLIEIIPERQSAIGINDIVSLSPDFRLRESWAATVIVFSVDTPLTSSRRIAAGRRPAWSPIRDGQITRLGAEEIT